MNGPLGRAAAFRAGLGIGASAGWSATIGLFELPGLEDLAEAVDEFIKDSDSWWEGVKRNLERMAKRISAPE